MFRTIDELREAIFDAVEKAETAGEVEPADGPQIPEQCFGCGGPGLTLTRIVSPGNPWLCHRCYGGVYGSAWVSSMADEMEADQLEKMYANGDAA
jgi:hypothetical protein